MFDCKQWKPLAVWIDTKAKCLLLYGHLPPWLFILRARLFASVWKAYLRLKSWLDRSLNLQQEDKLIWLIRWSMCKASVLCLSPFWKMKPSQQVQLVTSCPANMNKSKRVCCHQTGLAVSRDFWEIGLAWVVSEGTVVGYWCYLAGGDELKAKRTGFARHTFSRQFYYNDLPSICPSCRMLFKDGLFPKGTRIVGYARSALAVEQLKERCKPFLKVWTRCCHSYCPCTMLLLDSCSHAASDTSSLPSPFFPSFSSPLPSSSFPTSPSSFCSSIPLLLDSRPVTDCLWLLSYAVYLVWQNE